MILEIGRENGVDLKRILVVEDNDDNREILVYRLQRMGGYEVVAASNGKEALEVASQAKPDLVFMDLRMPVMDGWQATHALRQTAWGKNLPIIAVTAHTMDADREKALQGGFTDYIPKPITDYSFLQRKIQSLFKDSPGNP